MDSSAYRRRRRQLSRRVSLTSTVVTLGLEHWLAALRGP